MGERSPHNDAFVRGTFLNISMDTKREDMTLAVLEGVAFAIKDSFEIAKSQGIHIETSKICGGGAKSKLWKQIMANVLNIDIEVPQNEEGPGYGLSLIHIYIIPGLLPLLAVFGIYWWLSKKNQNFAIITIIILVISIGGSFIGLFLSLIHI